MADTAVAITAGSGTNIDTRTEATNGNHRQVVVLGDPSTNANVAAVTSASTAAAASDPALVVAISPNGEVAHDAVDSGNGSKIAAKAIAGLSGAALVAAADRTDLYAGTDGALIIRPHCGLEDLVSGVAAITDGSSTSVIAAGGAGVKNYVTGFIIANTSATPVTVDIRDGAAGTVKATIPVPANYLGAISNFSAPLGGFTANTAVYADPSAAASTVTVTLIGFKSKV